MKLRVLHCIYDDPKNPWVGGGGALRVWELYRRLTPLVRVTVATGNYRGARNGSVEGVRYLRLGTAASYPLSRLSYGARASLLLRSRRFDAVVFDFSVYTPIHLPTQARVGLVVHMLHGPSAPTRWGRIGGSAVAAVERRMLQRARWICTTSDLLREQVQAIVPAARIDVVPSGVSEDFFRVRREESDFLLCYGRFDLFQKGIDTVVDAFGLLAPEHPGLMLRIAGRGKDADAVAALVRRSEHADRISLITDPSRDEVLRLMAGARLLLAPSRVEGLPMAPAEAMAAGVPVVAGAVGAMAAVVQPPAGGGLVPPGDARSLARMADRFLQDGPLRKRTSESARDAARRFSWDRVAEEHFRFLKHLATAGRPS